jgi:antitoxin ChpS
VTEFACFGRQTPCHDSLPGRRYTLAELLVESDYTQAQPPEEREWVDAPATGREPV